MSCEAGLIHNGQMYVFASYTKIQPTFEAFSHIVLNLHHLTSEPLVLKVQDINCRMELLLKTVTRCVIGHFELILSVLCASATLVTQHAFQCLFKIFRLDGCQSSKAAMRI